MSRGPVLSPELAWQIADKVGRLYAQQLAEAEEALVDEEVTVAELIALVVLESFPDGVTQIEWGRCQGVSRQRAHVVTTRLHAAELITVQRAGRSSAVRLSRGGRALVRRLRPRLSERLATSMDAVGAAEARLLSDLLTKLTEEQSVE